MQRLNGFMEFQAYLKQNILVVQTTMDSVAKRLCHCPMWIDD